MIRSRQNGRTLNDGPEQPEIEKREQEEVLSRAAISARVVYQAILVEGETELRRPASALVFSGLAAGLSMGFSLVAQGLLQSHLPDTAWRVLVSKTGYAVGFLIVVLGRQQLFTENTLTAVLPFLRNKSLTVFLNVTRLWLLVLVANIAGAFFFAWLLARTAAFGDDVKNAFAEIGRAPLTLSFGVVWIRGVFAGWLIALMVWLLPFAESARIWVIGVLTYLIGLGSLTHIIAGSVDVLYLVAAGQISWGKYVQAFMLPTLLGNIVGGVSLVAVLNHAQVTAGQEKQTL